MEEQEREEHHKVTEEFEDEVDRLQRPSGDLKEDIKDAEDDWEQKTKTESVPGAMELPDPDDEPEPNRFEYEERTMEGPSSVEDESEDGDDSEDDDG